MRAEISFSAEGTALTAFRDALRQANVRCRHQVVKNGVFYAAVPPQQFCTVRALAERHGIALTVLKKRGLRFHLLPYRKRFGILPGLLLGALLLYWSSAYVRSIEIYGNETVSDAEVLTALESLGISRGTPIREIAFTASERRMRLAIGEIDWIAMRHVGGRLIVEMTENRAAPEMYDDHVPTNVTAAYDAQITSVSVLGGQAVCKRGDVVRKGDLLISGAVTDSRGTQRFYHGDGIVTGVYQADFEQEQPFVTELAVSGEAKTAQLLEVFGRRFSLSPGFSPPAGDFVYTEESHPLTLLGHTLPFTRIACQYTQRQTALTVWSEEEAVGLLRESAARWEQNFHSGDRILARSESISRSDLGISLKFHYVFEGVIGKTSEIFVKLS
jgi:similar to stage IV sporulation protein